MPHPCFLVADISRQRESCSEGTVGPSREPPLLPGFTPEPRQPFTSPSGTSVSLSGKWGCGQNSACPMGCQDALPSQAHRCKVMVLRLLRLQTERPGEARGLRTTALGSPITMWSRRGQASAGWDPGQGSCGPGRGSPGRPRFLPPGAGGPSRAPPCPLQPLGTWPGGSR